MGVSIQDRTDFLNMLDACRTEQQLFSRLTFAVMFHQSPTSASHVSQPRSCMVLSRVRI